MNQAATTRASTPAADAALFVAEFDNACSLHRLYGPDHPAYQRGAQSAAASAKAGLALSVTSGGFAVGSTAIDNPKLASFARRLRSLGLIGLNVESPPDAAQVTDLVATLAELQSEHATAETAVARISESSGGTITAVALKLGGLKLVEGTQGRAKESHSTRLWTDLFAQACGNAAPTVGPKELARSFEATLGPAPSDQNWKEVARAWANELRELGPATGALVAQANCGARQVGGAQPSQPVPPDAQPPGHQAAVSTTTQTPDVGHPGVGGSQSPIAAISQIDPAAFRLEAASSFLNALSPGLSQRLLSEAFSGELVPDAFILALTERLPAIVVLGALSAVDRNNGEPSQAALALLRKIALQAGQQTQVEPPPRTNQELARTAAFLQDLLQTDREQAFVPEEYLRRRQELSRTPVPAEFSGAFPCPGDHDTARHAAELVLQMLSSPEAEPQHISAGLAFLAGRLPSWIRGGDFQETASAMCLARGLLGHPDESVAAAARMVLDTRLTAGDLHEGVRRLPAATAVQVTAELLRECEGDKFAAILSSYDLKGSEPGDDVLLEAIRRVLTAAPEHCARGVASTPGDKPPLALLSILLRLEKVAAMKTVEAIVPHAGPGVRRAVLQQVFRRNIPWPLPLTERLLKDDQFAVRRLAVMRLVRDQDEAVAAKYLAATAGDPEYPLDVGVGLAELLHPHRGHREVRAACRRWFWSPRRLRALFSFSFGEGKAAG